MNENSVLRVLRLPNAEELGFAATGDLLSNNGGNALRIKNSHFVLLGL